MMNTATAQLLDLSARAAATTDAGALLDLLQAGHAHWCTGLAEVRTDVTARCSRLDDAATASWCTRAGAPWEPGTSRKDAITHLAFALWDASPAAMAYTELATRAADHGVSLIPG
jgi:hypothetical protein